MDESCGEPAIELSCISAMELEAHETSGARAPEPIYVPEEVHQAHYFEMVPAEVEESQTEPALSAEDGAAAQSAEESTEQSAAEVTTDVVPDAGDDLQKESSEEAAEEAATTGSAESAEEVPEAQAVPTSGEAAPEVEEEIAAAQVVTEVQEEAAGSPAVNAAAVSMMRIDGSTDHEEHEHGLLDEVEEVEEVEYKFHDKLAALEAIVDADDKLKAAVEKIAQQAERIRLLEARVRGLTNECAMATRLAKSWRLKFERSGKA